MFFERIPIDLLLELSSSVLKHIHHSMVIIGLLLAITSLMWRKSLYPYVLSGSTILLLAWVIQSDKCSFPLQDILVFAPFESIGNLSAFAAVLLVELNRNLLVGAIVCILLATIWVLVSEGGGEASKRSPRNSLSHVFLANLPLYSLSILVVLVLMGWELALCAAIAQSLSISLLAMRRGTSWAVRWGFLCAQCAFFVHAVLAARVSILAIDYNVGDLMNCYGLFQWTVPIRLYQMIEIGLCVTAVVLPHQMFVKAYGVDSLTSTDTLNTNERIEFVNLATHLSLQFAATVQTIALISWLLYCVAYYSSLRYLPVWYCLMQ